MNDEFKDFIEELELQVNCRIYFKNSSELQNIIDKCSFKRDDIIKFMKCELIVGHKIGFMKCNSSFKSTIYTIENLLKKSDYQMNYVSCYDNNSIVNIIGYPSYKNKEFIFYFSRIDMLKAFL